MIGLVAAVALISGSALALGWSINMNGNLENHA